MLAALPDNGPAPALSLVTLLAPFAAGAVGGWRSLHGAPVPVNEAAPLWGFICGIGTGVVWGGLSALARGPLGADRLAEIGSSPWQVGVVVALEVGVSAAIAAWVNWRQLRDTFDGVKTARPASTPARKGEEDRKPRLARCGCPARSGATYGGGSGTTTQTSCTASPTRPTPASTGKRIRLGPAALKSSAPTAGRGSAH